MVGTIKRGYDAPNSEDLETYQLGWSIDKKLLYIKNADGQVVSILNEDAISQIIAKYLETDAFKAKVESIVKGLNTESSTDSTTEE